MHMNETRTDRERLNRVLFYAVVGLLGYLSFRILQPFIQPLAWAVIIAVAVHPLFKKAEPRWGAGRSALLLTVGVTLLLIVPAIFLAVGLVKQASGAVPALQSAIQDAENHKAVARAISWAQEHLPLPPFEEIKSRLLGLASRLSRLMAAQAGTIMKNTSLFFFNLLLTLFALFFLLRDSDRFAPAIRRQLPFDGARSVQLVNQTRELIHTGVVTTLILAAAQGVAGGIILLILGFGTPVFWGVAMGFCSFVPMVGSAIVWVPAALWLLVAGHWIKGVVLLALGFGVISMMDNILRPLLMTGRTTMNGLLIFISLVGGISAFGLMGLVLGPVVAAAALSLLGALGPGEAEP
jgi:predicted PurR-regulated permease PerM